MRINLGLNLVSSQPLFSVGIGNLPETYGANRARKEFCMNPKYRLQISGRMKLRHHHSKGDSKPCPRRLYN